MKNIVTKFNNFIFELFDYKNYKKISDNGNKIIYEFILNNNAYLVIFNKLENNKNYYHLSFCLIDENNEEVYLLLNDVKKSFKVLSNVKHITKDFLVEKTVYMLLYDSLDEEREYVYTSFAKEVVSENYFRFYKIKRCANKVIFILANIQSNDYKKYIDNESYFNKIFKKLKEI